MLGGFCDAPVMTSAVKQIGLMHAQRHIIEVVYSRS